VALASSAAERDRWGEAVERYADLAARVRALPPSCGPVRVVAVDGPAGSGKTVFAGRLARELPEGVVLHVDDLLAGWADLEGWWGRFVPQVLRPLAEARPARYRRWDWVTQAPGDWQEVPVGPVLVVEGVGSARRAAEPWLTGSVYVTAPRELRLARGIARDGERLRPEWLAWMAAEDAHFAAERTADRADLLVDGAPRVAHDPAIAYVALSRRDGAG
jgi:hypothetical protein